VKYIQALAISVLAFSLTWASASVIQQLLNGACAMKGGCIGNVILTATIGLYLSLLLAIPLALAMALVQRKRLARFRYAALYMPAVAGMASGVANLSLLHIMGMPWDLMLWLAVFLLIYVVMTLIFYRQGG